MKIIRKTVRWCVSILLCVGMIGSLFGGGVSNAAGSASSSEMHVVVRHFHADGSTTVVEGNLTSDKFDLGEASTPENSAGEKEEVNPSGIEKSAQLIEGALQVSAIPEAGEEFSGFAVAAGHSAVTENLTPSPYVSIKYDSSIHLVKVQVYYRSTQASVKGENFAEATGTDLVDLKDHPEIDTIISGTDRLYNTSPGLHTDKRVSEIPGSDGRTYDLTLESWYSGGNISDIGLILDASGSMAWTSENLEPYKVSNEDVPEEYWTTADASDITYLTSAQVESVLNKNNTDNSKLGYSGYSYYIYDPRSTVKEFVPIGYWSGESVKLNNPAINIKDIPFSMGLLGYYNFEGNCKNILTDGEPTFNGSAGEIKYTKGGEGFSKNSSLNSNDSAEKEEKVGKALSLKETAENGYITLDVSPTAGNFSISFAIRPTDTETAERPTANVPLITIEPEGKEKNQLIIYRRNGSSHNHIRFSENGGNTKQINDVFPNGNTIWQVMTVVVSSEGGKSSLQVYLNGKKKDDPVLLKEGVWDDSEKVQIKIAEGIDVETCVSDIYLDSVFVYDCALTETNVSTLYSKMQGGVEKKYYAATEDGENIALIDAVLNDAPGSKEGWYYVNSDGNWDIAFFNKELLTSKNLIGISTGKDSTHQITYENVISDTKLPNSVKEYFTKAGISVDSANNAAQKYDPDNPEPIKFFVDRYGYLRCFYSSSASTSTAGAYGCSYVYQKPDDSRIKVESLQYALSSFISSLSAKSPDSRISAVRFSTATLYQSEKYNDLDKLVLLDWTKSSEEGIGILGLGRDDHSSKGSETSDEPDNNNEKETDAGTIEQYNYGLTGGTQTWTGLKAYKTFLDSRSKRDNETHVPRKYLIIFTDGKDDNIDPEDAEEEENLVTTSNLAKDLKEEGYSIYSIMLAGGSIDDKDDPKGAYKKAFDFLTELSGAGKDQEERGKYVYDASNAEELSEAFSQILTDIVENLDDYTVKDYIDPRFNLMDAYDNLFVLKDGGKVSIVQNERQAENYITKSEDIQLGDEGLEIRFKIYQTEDDIEDELNSGVKAALKYDSTNHMYYLEWTDQSIPGCGIGAEKLSVWRSTIRIQAKEDFIGGNGILTNGNAENMNMVYSSKGDAGNSSGTEDMYMHDETEEHKAADAYPSKGFPRTAVNVAPLELSMSSLEKTIYMGEDINPGEVLDALSEKITKSYYWEYLRRYGANTEDDGDDNAYRINNSLDYEKLIQKLMTDGSLEVPYSYLMAVDGENQTGTNKHRADVVGTLKYTWEETVEDAASGPSDPAEKTTLFTTKDSKDRTYKLTVTFDPLPIDGSGLSRAKNIYDSSDKGHSLITDEDYTLSLQKNASEDSTGRVVQKAESDRVAVYYVPEGSEVEEKPAEGTYTFDIVSGSLALELKLKKSDLTYLKERESNTSWMKDYTVQVQRAYNTLPEEKPWKARFDLSNFESLTPDEKGYVTFYSKQLEEELPIGEYTLTVPEGVAPFTVTSFEVENDNVQYTKDRFNSATLGHIAKEKGVDVTSLTSENLNEYLASSHTDNPKSSTPVIFGLGIEDVSGAAAAEASDATYLSKRLGIAVLTAELQGDLVISKTVVDKVDDKTKESGKAFTFKVELKNGETALDGKYSYTIYQKKETGDSEDSSGVIQNGGTLTLTDGQYAIVTGLPMGTDYKVTENEANKDSYVTSWENYQENPSKERIEGSSISSSSEDVDSEDAPAAPSGTIRAKAYATAHVDYTNTYQAKGSMNLTVQKELKGRGWKDEETFDIQLTASGATAQAIAGGEITVTLDGATAGNEVTSGEETAYTHTVALGKSDTTGKIWEFTFRKVGEYTFTLEEKVPTGAVDGKLSGLTYDKKKYTVTAKVEEETSGSPASVLKNGNLKVSVVISEPDSTPVQPKDASATIKFVNQYSAEGTLELPVQKTYKGKDWGDEEFTFTLEAQDDATSSAITDGLIELPTPGTITISAPTATVSEPNQEASDGTVNTGKFGEITFHTDPDADGTEEGPAVYYFTVTETGIEGVPSADLGNITKTPDSVDVTVTVTDNGDGTLTVEAETAGQGGTPGEAINAENPIAFVNTYTPAPVTYAPTVTKTVKGAMPKNKTKTFTFKISEYVEKEENQSGSSAGSAVQSGFTLPEKKEVSLEVTTEANPATGTFDEITFTKEGDYQFAVEEVPDSSDSEYLYDTSKWLLTVTVAYNKETGRLSVESSTYQLLEDPGTSASQAKFINILPVGVAPQVQKTVKPDLLPEDWAGKNFTFTLTRTDTGTGSVYLKNSEGVYEKVSETLPLPELTLTVKGGTTPAPAAGSFPTLYFDTPGKYKFQISEEPIDHYTSDGDWIMTVTVKEDLTKEVIYEKAGAASNSSEAQFENTYTPKEITYSPSVKKTVTGSPIPEPGKNFTFSLEALDGPEGGADLPEVRTLTLAVNPQGAADGVTGKFGAITFHKEGTYTFAIKEQKPAEQDSAGGQTESYNGYTFDETQWTLTVEVEDTNGVLKITETKYKAPEEESDPKYEATGKESGTEAAFVNQYAVEPVTFSPRVKKRVTGWEDLDDSIKESFTFIIAETEDQTGVEMPTVTSVTVTPEQIGSGAEVAFDDITFNQAGVYTFTLQEKPGNAAGYVYDLAVWKLTVEVTDMDHVLTVDNDNIKYEYGGQTSSSAAVFENTYSSGTLTLSKTVMGALGETDRDFTFTVTLLDKEENALTKDYPYNGSKTGTLKTGDTVTLKHDECITVYGLPAGSKVRVEEASVQEYQARVKVGAEGEKVALSAEAEIEAGQDTQIAYTNERPVPLGSLTISKTVEEAPASGTSPANEPNTQQPKNEVVGGGVSGGNMQGGSVSGGNVPGSSVSGGNAPGGNVSGGNVSGGNVSGGNPQGSPYTIGGSVSGGSVSGGSGPVSENRGSHLEGGFNLLSGTMPKNISGETKIRSDITFGFTIELSDTGISGLYGAMTFTGGIAHVDLHDGETVTASGLPAGLTYTVTENENKEYTSHYKGADGALTEGKITGGTIPANGEARADFVNVKKEEDTPPTQPTEEPTQPTEKPTNPTEEPAQPTEGPVNPTAEPTVNPSTEPTTGPADEPTAEPTTVPTAEPTASPTPAPTATPTPAPTAAPTPAPTPAPAPQKTPGPTPEATATPEPVVTPVPAPSPSPEPLRDPNLTYDENGDVVDANRQKKLPKTEDPMPLAGAALLAALSAGIMAALSGRSLAASQGRRRKKK